MKAGDRPFSVSELADALVGDEWRSVSSQIDELEYVSELVQIEAGEQPAVRCTLDDGLDTIKDLERREAKL
jgi:hypothetical protein